MFYIYIDVHFYVNKYACKRLLLVDSKDISHHQSQPVCVKTINFCCCFILSLCVILLVSLFVNLDEIFQLKPVKMYLILPLPLSFCYYTYKLVTWVNVEIYGDTCMEYVYIYINMDIYAHKQFCIIPFLFLKKSTSTPLKLL